MYIRVNEIIKILRPQSLEIEVPHFKNFGATGHYIRNPNIIVKTTHSCRRRHPYYKRTYIYYLNNNIS